VLTPPELVPELPRSRRPARPATPVLPSADKRNIMITSALPYVNNVPHLGNLIGCVLSADVYARYCRARGYNTIYICGTDEYGTATETKAAEMKMSPRAVCDKFHAIHRDIYQWFDVDFDFFGRTSCPDPSAPEHAAWPQTVIAQSIFKRLHEREMLVEQTVEQVFCTTCQKFLADRYIEGTCPLCKYPDARGDQCDKCGRLLNATELQEPRCALAKNGAGAHAVEVRTSEHLFLDLPKLSDRLTGWIDHSSRGRPAAAVSAAAAGAGAAAHAIAQAGRWSDNTLQTTNSWTRDGLKPRCITRDLKWGTPVPLPKYAHKVFYVWFDAPIGYLSITANYTPSWEAWWKNPAQVELAQFMGKDNIPFHTVIFPATLIGADDNFTLLHSISTTEYLNYETDADGRPGKFSKSRNQGVFGDQARETGIPAEVWRYYLLANRPESQDSQFTWSDFADKVNNELLKNLGNFVNRTLSFAFARCGEAIPACAAGAAGAREAKLLLDVAEGLAAYCAVMEAQRLRDGLHALMALSRLGNAYLQDSKPWDVIKSSEGQAHAIVAHAVALVYVLAAAAEPFMPGFSDKVLHQMNLPHPSLLPLELALLAPGHKLRAPAPLFREMTSSDVDYFRARFGGSHDASGAATPAPAAAPAAAVPAAAPAGATAPAPAGKAAKAGKGAAPAAPAAGAAAGAAAAGAAAAGAAAGGAAGSAAAAKPAKPAKGGKAPAAAAAAEPELPDIAYVDLRVGRIVRAWEHEGSVKLYCEEIDVGDKDAAGNPVTRQIASGLRAVYTLEQMQNRRCVVVCNLPPRPLAGFQSAGMVLCASDGDHDHRTKTEFVEPPAGAAIGERIQFPDLPGVPVLAGPAAEMLDKKRKKVWERVAPEFKTNANCEVTFGNARWMTSAGPCTVPSCASGPVS
jgi:methionyl-tRNA synthetase